MKLSLTEENVLRAIQTLPGTTQSQLAKLFETHHTTTHAFIDKMLARRQIERTLITGVLSVPES